MRLFTQNYNLKAPHIKLSQEFLLLVIIEMNCNCKFKSSNSLALFTLSQYRVPFSVCCCGCAEINMST